MTNEAELEAIKHQNAITLEKQKWQFRKQELTFLEAGQHLRASISSFGKYRAW
ncbi:hypothetical protein BAY1663_01772 [Pseudomonas sp. BAY1663]|uniref:hypothetical protein n=1 Tax=Pseudomonas sp. BAY1663 TaxID=1439940 RepID=UPI00042DF90E|nr:hypothetical protein [Pseudomonas sp. BAY1663]EXF45835.1 hypothetical protein BAY1663_01772 [Pseudomonas sp. BAY1663]